MHKILLFVLALVSATSLWAKPTFGPRAYTYEVEDGERLLLPAGTSHMPVFSIQGRRPISPCCWRRGMPR